MINQPPTDKNLSLHHLDAALKHLVNLPPVIADRFETQIAIRSINELISRILNDKL
jgi:hypothetical protein